ncbi:MAG: hypothetical protein P8Y10_15080, partial [Gemmatimonadales bacterium]
MVSSVVSVENAACDIRPAPRSIAACTMIGAHSEPVDAEAVAPPEVFPRVVDRDDSTRRVKDCHAGRQCLHLLE